MGRDPTSFPPKKNSARLIGLSKVTVRCQWKGPKPFAKTRVFLMEVGERSSFGICSDCFIFLNIIGPYTMYMICTYCIYTYLNYMYIYIYMNIK